MKRDDLRCAAHGECEHSGHRSARTRSTDIGDRLIATARSTLALCAGVAHLLLGGCATPAPPPAEPAPAVVSLEEWLARGDAARKDGLQEAARTAYREGARAYPTDKLPWLRLADGYFSAADYGNAVLAAQEAVQRDPRDNTAHSMLAVSGLRITAGSLAALREQSGYPVGSREEALDVTRRLREALSDPTLLPPAPPDPPSPSSRKPRLAKPATAASATVGGVSPAPTAPPSAAIGAPKAAPARGSNPLDKLK
jgi:tetratricopeptide (TPR) repeat protein